MAARAADEPGPVAGRIVGYVLRHEGAHFRAIMRDMALATGQTDHHLRRLVRAGLLVRTPLGGEVHFFPASRPAWERRPRAALLHPARRQLAAALLGAPGDGTRTLGELAARMGRPRSTTLHHLRTLVEAGVAFRVRAGRHVAYGLSDPGLTAMLLEARDAMPRPLRLPPAGGASPGPGTPPRRGPR